MASTTATVSPAERLRIGLEILAPHMVTGKLERLRYRGVGVEVDALPLGGPEYRRLQECGWSWSTDVEDPENQLWLFSW
jgi:hypothetical protein